MTVQNEIFVIVLLHDVCETSPGMFHLSSLEKVQYCRVYAYYILF